MLLIGLEVLRFFQDGKGLISFSDVRVCAYFLQR